MVYHFPGEEPWRNSRWLGPLRVLTSDDRAAQLARLGPSTMLSTGVFFTGVTCLVRAVPWSYAITSRYARTLGWSQAKATGALTTASLASQFTSLMFSEWSEHLRPDKAEWTPYVGDFYRAYDTRPDPDSLADARPGVMLIKDEARWFASPILTVDGGLGRALTTRGLTLWEFGKYALSVGIEAPVKANVRAILHYCGAPWYQSKADRHKLYQGLINTSAACYMCYDPTSDHYGSFVFDRVVLPYNETSSTVFDKIVAVVDHDTSELTKVVTYRTRATDDKLEVYVWGSDAHEEENAESARLSKAESLHQAGLLLAVVTATYSHAHTHWWANGVAAMEPGAWAQQGRATRMTQFMNAQSVFASWLFFGNSVATANDFLVTNNSRGIPAHGFFRQSEVATGEEEERTTVIRRRDPAALAATIGRRSTFHRMSVEALKDVAAALGEESDPATRVPPQAMSIVSGSVMHGLDHFMTGELMPVYGNGNCVALRTDLSGLLMSLVYPVDYWTTRAKVSQQRSRKDPVTEALWVAANRAADEIRAENAEAKANGAVRPPMTDPGKFVRKYFTVGCNI